MSIFHSKVESYVPVESFYQGKRETAGKLFRDRFAVVDTKANFSILAFRGENLKIGDSLEPEAEHLPLLQFHIARGERVLAKAKEETALFFGDWMWKGLVPVLLLQQSCSHLSAAAKLLMRKDLITFETGESDPISKRELNELCLQFSELLIECDSVFGKSESDQFRRHAARLAVFAGCRADFSNLPFDPFAISSFDTRKWTFLLLCLFLSLRGISEKEPAVTLRDIGREMILSGVDFLPSQDSKRQVPERFSFLNHPAFEDVEIETTPQGLRFSVLLSRSFKPGELRSISESVRISFLLITE